jgi:hypothetical protein
MVNPFKEVVWQPGPDELKAFAKSLVIGFPCVGLAMLVVIRITGGEWDARIPLMVAGYGALAGVVFLAVPLLGRPVYLVWYAAACCIGLVIANVLLGIVFYVFVTGIGVMLKLIGRDAMHRRPDRSAKTYWRDAEQPSDPRRYYSQF